MNLRRRRRRLDKTSTSQPALTPSHAVDYRRDSVVRQVLNGIVATSGHGVCPTGPMSGWVESHSAAETQTTHV